jgi:MoaA/NifB/PqqE/SkfB family radical SAM enzyme
MLDKFLKAVRRKRNAPAGQKIVLSQRSLVQPLYLQVTNICNADCVFCAYQHNGDKAECMPFATFTKVIDQFVDLGGKQINLTPITGDALVDSNLFDKIAYARARGIEVSFTTNGILLAKGDNYRKIVDLGVKWMPISTPGLDREAYKRVYRVDKYDQVMDGLIKIAEYKIATGSPISIDIGIRHDRPLSEVLRHEGWLRIKPYLEAGVFNAPEVNTTSVMHNWSGQIREDDLPGIMTLRQDPPAPPPSHSCAEIVFSAMVLVDGSVRVCACRYRGTPFDELVVGNVHEQDLWDILTSQRLFALISRTVSGDWPKACQGCSYYQPIHVSDVQLVGTGISGNQPPGVTTKKTAER